MTHEFKDMVMAFLKAKESGYKSVMATVVDLDGSSYRKPGVRMLLTQDSKMIGAVSGGCVEKDIARNAQSVFEDGRSKIMCYDGRYRLGCEGILYILIETFNPSELFIDAFKNAIDLRQPLEFISHYQKQEGVNDTMGTQITMGGDFYAVNQSAEKITGEDTLVFSQSLAPCFRLMIFGGEHDAVQLCKLASLNGWEVTIVTGPLESKTIDNFPGASQFFAAAPDTLSLDAIDQQTAVVLMSHNFANDLKFLIELKDSQPAYIGMLGPAHRRDKLLSQLMEYYPEVSSEFLDQIYGPAGLNIGAETPQEIAISILSEILSVVRSKVPMSLKAKKGGIHA